ncbi:AN1-type zinc finger protein 4 [Hyperolius riggenbachi]|uniref:AN1-type zinc finger protein 4 n=1 Tax=Hyperolius riggenbachi TaxID=752182 RepID=UPI0035A28AEF
MELFIETLTGTRFQLRVFPFETVARVKAKIQRLEGIPVAQQHLIWNNTELQDDVRLKEYMISEGCTLKLVLTTRAGPINTRRVPLENPIRELAELMDSVPDDVQEKLTSSKPVAFLVYRDGDQMNFVPVVDGTNGTLTPLSESLSGGSTSNLYGEDEDEIEASPSADQIIDNSITRIRMKLLKSKMESMTLIKKLRRSSVLKPRPPMAPRPSSGAVVAGRQKLLRVLPHIGQTCLPLENLHISKSSHNALSKLSAATRTIYITGDDPKEAQSLERSSGLENAQLSTSTVLPQITPLPKKDTAKESGSVLHSDVNLFSSEETSSGAECFALLTDVRPAEPFEELCSLGKVKSEFELSEETESSAIEASKTSVSNGLKSELMETGILNATDVSPLRNKFLSPVHFYTPVNDSVFPKAPRQPRCFDLGSLRPPTSHNLYHSLQLRSMAEPTFSRTARFRMRVESPTRRSDVPKVETRDVTEVANKSSKEPLDSRNNVRLFASLARSGSRENASQFRSIVAPPGTLQTEKIVPVNGKGGLFITPHASAVFGENSGEAAPLFPPVKPVFLSKNKEAKHCFLCRRRTNLATSFECRCGNNFCATHRYAETHNCTYDYKTAGRRHLKEANPVITAPKLPKI